VRDEVMASTGRKQEPYFTGSLGGGILSLIGPVQPTADAPSPGAGEAARICREVGAMSSLAALGVLERQHKGSLAGECIAARIGELKQQQTALAVATPPPVAGTFSPKRAAAPLISAEESGLRPKDSFKECAECPEMVVVPAGSFTMGSPPGEEGRSDS